MKKIFLAALVLAIVGFGCVSSSGPVTENKVLKTANSIYLDVRTVITDPEVMPMFTPSELDRLEDLERKYLEVADTLRAFPDDAEAIEQLSWIATEILYVINSVQVEKYRPYVAAIRISIKLLRNHI